MLGVGGVRFLPTGYAFLLLSDGMVVGCSAVNPGVHVVRGARLAPDAHCDAFDTARVTCHTSFQVGMPPMNRALARFLAAKRHATLSTSTVRTNFYREELVKHWQCLERQREYYSEKAITDVESVLGRLMSEVDRLCAQEHGDQLVSQLLRKIDGVTRLSAWSDRQKTH